MTSSLIHIVPFDIGYSFIDYDYSKKQSKEDFINLLLLKCNSENIRIEYGDSCKYMCVATINEYISCYLLEYGVGIFLIKRLDIVDMTKITEKFSNDYACQLYYRKKIEQKKILALEDNLGCISKFMDIVWSSVKNVIRPYTASHNYKYHGLSYVFSMYHIVDEGNADCQNDNKNIDLLMNPEILGAIMNESQWDSIKNKVDNYTCKSYSSEEFNDLSKVASSWSAVAIIEANCTNAVDIVTDYEILLQGSWFLFDCLTDNIKKSKMTNLNLQKQKSLVTNISLEISNISSANMSTNEKKIMEAIYSTSGMDILKEKLHLLLENRIAIEEARISKKHGVYGIITETLLVMFTLVSIYEPIRNVLTGNIEKVDFILAGAMLVVLIFTAILIIGKEK